MQLYLDTANVKEIQEAASLGRLDGATTPPPLVTKEGEARLWAKEPSCSLRAGRLKSRWGWRVREKERML